MDDPQVPDFMREFDDAKAARRNIYSNTLEAMKKRFPVEDENWRLELTDLDYDGPQEFSLAEQKKALLHNHNLRTNLVGTWRLVDKRTGQVVDQKKTSVMQVPYWTDRGTIINNGSEYTVISQSRLRPGVYARRKSNGEFEAQFNIRPGTGRAFHIGLQPETGVMTLQTGQGSVPLYQILKGLGVDDKQIVKYWGADVAMANSQKVDSQAWNKLYKRMAGYKAVPNAIEADKIQFVKDAVSKYEVDPEVVERTMGLRNVSTVTPELLLRASQKVLNVSRGDEKPDNRDNPRFSKFYGVEDYFKERIEKNAGRLANTLLYKARRNGNLKSIQRNALNPWVDTIINGSGLAMPGEEANPLSTLEQMSRISKFGLGGIGSADAVTMEARDVQGDYLGFVDPVQGPECFAPGSFIMSKAGYVKVEDVTYDTELACLVNGRLEYHKPERIIAEDYDGLLYCASTKFIQYKVTPNHRLWYKMTQGTLSYRFGYAGDLHERHITIMTGGHAPYVCDNELTEFIVPHVEKHSNHQKPDLPPIDIETWGSFLGWFISEGNVNGINVRITQAKPDHKDDLISVLDRIPCSYSRYQDDFIIGDMQLSAHLAPLGHSWEKRIPEYMFNATVAGRKALLESLCYGDGRRKHDTYTYCTISRGLAEDVERLCFSLGLSANIRFEKDDRPIARRTGGSWAVHINTRHQRELFGGNVWHRNNYFTELYSGKVYCVTVPGGTVYARFGDRGGHWTGNSEKIGVDVRASYHTYLGKDNKLYGEFIDNRTGKKEFVDIATAADRMVAFPGQDPNSPYLVAIKDGIPQRVPRDEVRYTVPSYGHMIGSNTNVNIMPTTVQAGRQFYGSKFWSQYLPQAKGEVPLVDTLMPDGKTTWREYYGRKVGTLGAEADGVVTKVTDDEITIKGNDGKVYKRDLVKNLPFNRLSAISYYPAVEVGQSVKAGDMIAHSNFTDKKTGSINMGQNLSVAIVPDGNSFEDAYVISESAAKRLATDRLYSFDHETRNGVTIGKNKYISAFPSKFTKEQIETLDENGVVKPGTVLHRGDPVVLSLGPKILSSQDKALGKLSKALRNSYVDRSEIWEHDYEGKVVDSAATSKGAKVNVSAQPPVRVGDKLAPAFGLKGVVGKIYEDDKMPRNAVTNQPYDVLMNTMGFLSRVAPGQLMEISLGKIAKKTGKQIRIPQLPPPEGWYRWTQAQMKANNVPETSDVFDPVSGRTLHDIGDGYMYTMAFHHLAEKKASAVGADGSYTQDEQPAKGGFEGAKRISGLDLWAMLSHNVPEVIKDSHIIRGTRNDAYWRALQLGLPVPEPEEPFIYKKFLNTLRAGGVNVTEKGSITKIMPQTDKDIDQLAQGRVLTTSDMVDPDFEPMKGGLFDLGKTGGMGGNQWSMIQLPEPVPNPIMEEPVRRLLGLTVAKMEDILAGREKLNGKTGGQALKDALSNINVDQRLAEAKKGITSLRGQKRDDAIKVYRYLSAMKEQGLKPQDWMVSKVPVIPPAFRPVSKMGDVALVSDLNDLYKDVIENAKNFEELRKDVSDEGLADERLDIYRSVKAAYGLGEPITPENAAKGVKGALKQVIGSRPKFGMGQAKVFSKTVNGVARGVVTPDKNLDMDQLGLPEDMAWPIYKPYVMRSLVQHGYPTVAAIKMIADRTDTARHLLEEEMAKRPVIMDRAPTWHKFNFLAFKPSLTKSKSIRVSPLIVSGFNMDFNGDSILNPLIFACINGKFVVEYMASIIREYFLPDFTESSAVEMLGKTTTFLRLKENTMKILGIKEDGTTGFVDVDDISIHTSHGPDCYHVKTRDGLDAVFTAHHNFWGLDEQCRLIPCKTTEVGVGSLVPFAAEFDIPDTGEDPKAPRSIRRTYETGLWFGHYFGDGSITGRKDTISQAGTDPELLRLLEEIGSDIFGLDAWYEGNGKSVRWTSKMWATWFGTLGHNAEGKLIPGWMLGSGKEFLKGLLCGFILAEGHNCTSGGCVRVEGINRPLLVQIKYIAQSLGCICRLRQGKPERKSKKTDATLHATWYADINTTTLAAAGLWWPNVKKAKQFIEARVPTRKNWDLMPFPKCVQEVCAKQGKILQALRGDKRKKFLSDSSVKAESKQYWQALSNGYCTRDFARQIIVGYGLDMLSDNAVAKAWIGFVNNTTIRWDVIEEYGKTERPDVTYDMCVPSMQAFSVDGAYLTHNTVNMHVPSSDKAVQQAMDKMLPSENLTSLTDLKSPRHTPSKEQIFGLYALTKGVNADKPPVVFNSVSEAKQAYARGEIGPNDPIEIRG